MGKKQNKCGTNISV